MDRQDLLARAERALDGAGELGLDDIEIAADWVGGAVVELEKNDINLASSDDEATWGVRVLTEGRIGFATTNDANQLEATIARLKAELVAELIAELRGQLDPAIEARVAQGPRDHFRPAIMSVEPWLADQHPVARRAAHATPPCLNEKRLRRP